MGMKKKRARTPKEGRRAAKEPGTPRQVVLKKEDIEVALHRMEHWCAVLRKAVRAYDSNVGKAILFDPGDGVIFEPPRGDVVDCPPGGGFVPVPPGDVVDCPPEKDVKQGGDEGVCRCGACGCGCGYCRCCCGCCRRGCGGFHGFGGYGGGWPFTPRWPHW